ncbi:general transcription factor IIH subunit 3-like isoform X1 [Paramuricea clavata]|uniref:General transcription factor IIH subunit 3 n=1 Tax=Paramuricea clavata TaxID=317549 RepID=A0A6S7GZ21_PARCT|nr:general transcription factor IIH subunit 3-like isoform X1 [Paramuricea clavata]
MAEDTFRRLLVVVCDLSPIWWGKQAANASENSDKMQPINAFLNNVLVFCNAHLMMKHTNELAIVCATSSKSQFIYPCPEDVSDANGEESYGNMDGKYEHFATMNNVVVDKVKNIIEEESADDVNLPENSATLLAGALSMTLCYIRQAERNCPVGQSMKARILVLKGSQDVSTQYMATMNCIFAAQKNNVTIDSCLLMSDSGFLQQASDITGGVYFKITKMESLLQYLLWMFLPDPNTRESLVMPGAVQIDYRAACFCHRTLVDIGFVCSVCLSIYCQLLPRCHTCQTRFKLPSAAMTRPKKKKKEKTAD